MNTSLPDTEEIHRPPEPAGHPSSIEALADDMVARWREGERPRTEFYLERHPHLQQDSDAVLELIAEELALHEEYRLPVSLDDLQARFPQWPARLRALVLCQQTLGRQPATFPQVGESLGEYRLMAELGRGSHARVYLAAQPALGDRPVVLKLGPVAGQEHLSLARLQHSHIVPLYSVHEFPAQGLRGLCLPYFGGQTLDDAISRLKKQDGPIAGPDAFALLRDAQAAGPATWEAIYQAPLAEVVAWIGACLADALQYAHDRGLLHLDVKPSNVLLAADGTPMLLDFHLARPPLTAGESLAWLGGTPGFMAPEQAAVLAAVRAGEAAPNDVDARADVFSLGTVLRKTLDALGRDSQSPAVTVGLSDILAKATANRPEDRYSTAAAFADDLRRHLADHPLRGVPNRSLAERWRKWRRRRPNGLPLLLAFGAILFMLGGLGLHWDRQADRAAAAHREGLARLNEGRYAEAIDTLSGGERLAAGLPLHSSLRAKLAEARRTAERGQAADDLHCLCDQLRPLFVAEFASLAQLQHVERRCREVWQEREVLATRLDGQANPDMDRRWRADLLDVAILAIRTRERLATPAALREVHREALLTLDQAEGLLGGSHILYLERSRHAQAAAQYALADRAADEAQAHPPESAWDHLVLGRHYLAAGDVRRAAGEIDRCLERDPGMLWGHYFKGVVCLRLGHAVEAVAAFASCAALAPAAAWGAYNLGLAYAEAGELELALAQFDRALTLDPTLAASYLGRASVHLKKGRPADALSDLARATDAGIRSAELEYRRAMAYAALGHRASAIESLRKCLEMEPRHVPAQDLMAKMKGESTSH